MKATMPKGKYFVGDLPLFIKEGVINWDEIKDGKHDEIMAFVGASLCLRNSKNGNNWMCHG